MKWKQDNIWKIKCDAFRKKKATEVLWVVLTKTSDPGSNL